MGGGGEGGGVAAECCDALAVGRWGEEEGEGELAPGELDEILRLVGVTPAAAASPAQRRAGLAPQPAGC